MSSKEDTEDVLELLRSTPDGLTAEELSRVLGIDRQRVQTAVRNAVATHMVEAPRDPLAPKNYRRSRYIHIANTRTKVQSSTLSWRDRGTYTGPDWASACSRPGCLDHEQYGSRVGNEVVPFNTRRY